MTSSDKPAVATTATAYLQGLTAKLLTCTVTWEPGRQTTVLSPARTHDRAHDNWCRNLLISVRSALAGLGLSGGFVVTFDHVPPVHAHPDLAVVAACLHAVGFDLGDVAKNLYLGSLGYTGDRVAPVRGVFPILETVEGFTRTVVPRDNAIEAGANTNRIVCMSAAHVHDLIDPTSLSSGFAPRSMEAWSPVTAPALPAGLSSVTIEKLMWASASGANVLLVGENPLAVARAFHTMLPRLTASEARAIMSVHSAVGLLSDGKIPVARPFRAPHHTVAERALVGEFDHPGEVSLAHCGTLVLDHVLDFKRAGLVRLADVVQTNRVRCARSGVLVEYPARCRIVATVYPDELRFLTPDRVAFLGDFVGLSL